jgi:hypothetical protein
VETPLNRTFRRARRGNMRPHEYIFICRYPLHIDGACIRLMAVGRIGRSHIKGCDHMALSAKDVAIELDVDAKTFRRFVRAYVKRQGGVIGDDTPGRGGRYAFDEGDLDAIRDAFNAWRTTRSGMLISFVSDDDVSADE